MSARDLPAQLQPGHQTTPLPIATAVEAWNLMGGIDWSALPIVIDLLGVSDPEALIAQLVAIRDYQYAQGND